MQSLVSAGANTAEREALLPSVQRCSHDRVVYSVSGFCVQVEVLYILICTFSDSRNRKQGNQLTNKNVSTDVKTLTWATSTCPCTEWTVRACVCVCVRAEGGILRSSSANEC